MNREEYSKKFYPQSLYRKPLIEGIQKYEALQNLDTELPNLSNICESIKPILIKQLEKLYSNIVNILLPSFNHTAFLENIIKRIGLHENTSPVKKVPPSQLWNAIEKPALNTLKIYLLETQADNILKYFDKKLFYLVRNYSRYLPKHISETEKDDLLSIAQIELLETIKAWSPVKHDEIWPLAYSRINGAMKDYIRFISKSDPARMFDWITDTAVIYTHFKQENNPHTKIESSYELSRAMEILNDRERKILVSYIKEDKTFSTISRELDLSESQISRIYKTIIEKLKRELKK